MNNNTNIFIISLALLIGVSAAEAESTVVIKVRAINPLDEEALVTIHYPFPAGLTFKDVLAKRIARGSGPAAPADFQINLDEGAKIYFLDHQITLAPKEIVVMEVEAKDVWTVPQKIIDGLKKQVEDLLTSRLPLEGEEAAAGPDPVVLKLKEEIFRQLEEIVENQEATAITQLGVQRHIEAYQKNREMLEQVRMDITMLRNMLSAQEAQEGEEKSSGEQELQEQAPSPALQNASVPAAVTEPAVQKRSVADKLKSLFKWK